MGAGCVFGGAAADDAVEGGGTRSALCIGIPAGGVLRPAAVLHGVHQTNITGAQTATDTLLELQGNHSGRDKGADTGTHHERGGVYSYRHLIGHRAEGREVVEGDAGRYRTVADSRDNAVLPDARIWRNRRRDT